MEFKIKKVSAMVLATSVVFGGSAMAAYGPAPAPAVSSNYWMLSVGYGQTFGHKKIKMPLFPIQPGPVIPSGGEPIAAADAAFDAQQPIAWSESNNVPSAYEGQVEPDLHLKDLKILEVDLFHSSGFGLVYLGTADDKGMLQYGGVELAKYEFSGIFGAYKMNFGQNMSLRGGVGQTTQKYKGTLTSKLDGEMAWHVEGKYHFKLSDSLAAFGAVGYLQQKELDLEQYDKYDPSSGYWKVGLSMSM